MVPVVSQKKNYNKRTPQGIEPGARGAPCLTGVRVCVWKCVTVVKVTEFVLVWVRAPLWPC